MLLTTFRKVTALASLILLISFSTNAQNQALDLSGAGNEVNVTYNLNTGGFTLEQWVYFPSGLTTTTSILNQTSGNIAAPLDAYLNSDGSITYWMGDGTSSNNTTTAPGLISANTWHHIAFVYDPAATSSEGQLFLDGNSTPAHTLDVTFALGNIGPFRIGRRADALEGDPIYFDEVRIWGVARDGATISADYNQELLGNEANLDVYLRFENTLTDDAFVNGLQNGGVVAGSIGYVAGAPIQENNYTLNFDGVNEYVDLGTNIRDQLTGLPNVTVEAWVYRTADKAFHTVFGNYGSDLQTMLRIDGNPAANVAFWVNNGTGFTSAVGSSSVPINTWTHIAGTWDGTTIRVYINGVEDGSALYSGSLANVASNYHIGGDPTAPVGEFMQGQIDEMRVWSSTRTASQLLAFKDVELNGPEPNLVAYYNFESGLTSTLLLDRENDLPDSDGSLTNMEPNSDWVVATHGVAPAGPLDATNPTVSITSVAPDPTATSPIPITITFSEEVVGFELVDIQVINGVPGNLNTADNITFTADITPSGSNVLIDVFVSSVTDLTGNFNDAAPQFSITYDADPPIITATSLSSDRTKIFVEFSEPIYGANDGSTPVDAGDFDVTSSGGTATVTFNSLLVLSPSEVELDITINGVPDGAEEIDVTPFATSVYDAVGNIMSTTQTGNKTNLIDNSVLSFDGIDDYVRVPTNAILENQNYTLEAWMNIPELPSGNDSYTLISKGTLNTDGGLTRNGYSLLYGDMGGGNAIILGHHSSFDTEVVQYLTTLNLDTWYHIAATYDGTTMKIFLDGVEVASNASLGANDVVYSGDNLDLKIGGFEGSSVTDNMRGKLDEVRIWDIAKNVTQINAEKDYILTGSESGLVAYYDFSDATGSILSDLANSLDGTLTDMDLAGATGNWVSGGPVINSTMSVTTTTPIQNESNILASDDIIIDFDATLDGSSLNATNIKVWGSHSGLATATYSGGGTASLTINPDVDFLAGEKVSVIITNGVRGLAGEVAVPFSLNFLIETAPFEGAFVKETTALEGVVDGAAAWADYDGDGDLDVAVSGWDSDYSFAIIKIFNNSGGTFTDIGASITGVYEGSLDWGDYDNDGDLDLFTTGIDELSNTTAVLYQNNAGTFSDAGGPFQGVYYSEADWGDYDNDGDLDLIVQGQYQVTPALGSTNIYRNDGGTFTNINAGLPGRRLGGIAWGDYDNDGDLDFVNSGYDNSTSYMANIYENDGGVFTDIAAGLVGRTLGVVEWGDYDNDMDLDLVVSGASASDNTPTIYRNDAGSFIDINAGLLENAEGEIAWGDYDGDGDLDLVINGSGETNDPTTTIYDNNAGSFVNSGLQVENYLYSTVDWGDFDNDGDLDLLMTGTDDFNGGRISLYSNALAPPKILNATNVSTAGFTPNLVAPPGAIDLIVDVSTDPQFGSFDSQDVSVGISGGIDINTTLIAGTQYFYRAKSDFGGSESTYFVSNGFMVQPGNALPFTGSDYVNIFDSDILEPTGDFTIEFWLNTTAVGNKIILEKGNTNAEYSVQQFSGDVIGFNVNGGTMQTVGSYNDGTWHHVAIVYRGAGDGTIYVDGVDDTDGSITLGAPAYSFGTLSIGDRKFGGSFNIEGSIDEVRIWDDERLLSEINANRYNTLVGDEQGLIAYYSFDETSGTTTLPDLSGNALSGDLTNMDGTEWAASGAMILQPPAGPTNFLAYESSPTDITLEWTDNATNEIGFLIETSTDYAFSSPIDITSAVSPANPGVDVTTVTYNVGMNQPYFYRVTAINGFEDASSQSSIEFATTEAFAGQALSFDGTDDLVAVPHDPQLNLVSGDFAIETWVYLNASGPQTIASKGDGNGIATADAWIFQIQGDKIALQLVDGVSTSEWGLSTTNVPLNEWVHVAVSFTGTTASFYLNGVADGTHNYGFSPADNGDSQSMYMARQGSVCACNYLNGDLDELKIWSAVKSDFSDRYSLVDLSIPQPNLVAYYSFDEGVGATNTVDASANINDGSINGATSIPSTVVQDGVVSNTNDFGPGSLRTAIEWANSNVGSDTIKFSLSGTVSLWTITPTTLLPTITDDSLVIDGSTQPGWDPITGDMITLYGANFSTNVSNYDGLEITADHVEVYGIRFDGWGNECIETSAAHHLTVGDVTRGNVFINSPTSVNFNNSDHGYFGYNLVGVDYDSITNGGMTNNALRVVNSDSSKVYNNVFGYGTNSSASALQFSTGIYAEVRGNYIGITPGGADIGNTGRGISGDVSYIKIGGPNLEDRNYIVGNGSSGILSLGDYGEVENNYIGITSQGTVSGNGGAGVTVSNRDFGKVINNVITGNSGHGIAMTSSPESITIMGNLIGLMPDTLSAPGNGTSHDGIHINMASNAIIQDNYIGNAAQWGIRMYFDSNNNQIKGNRIGTGAVGSEDFGCGFGGIIMYLRPSNTTIGGNLAGQENIIAYNNGPAIEYELPSSGTSVAENNFVLNNSIYSNLEGIVATNSPNGSGAEFNKGIQPPVIESITSTLVSGTLQGNLTSYTGDIQIHLYETDGSANTQGTILIDSLNITGDTWSVGGSFGVSSEYTATVTIDTMGTSLYSATASIPPSVVTNTNDSGMGSLRDAIIYANANSPTTITFNIPGGGPWVIDVASAYPLLTGNGTIIDGSSQPGWVFGDPNAMVTLDGNLLGSSENGFNVQVDNVEIYGLRIINFPGNGIQGGSNINGVIIGSPTGGNVIGGNLDGIDVSGSWTVDNNRIGTTADGTGPNSNRHGIRQGGGTALITNNLISGNTSEGIHLVNFTGGANHTIEGNYIGTDVTGSSSMGNNNGIVINSHLNVTIQDNVISGNTGTAISSSQNTSGHQINRNNIGTDVTGVSPIPNGAGISFTNNVSNGRIGYKDNQNIIAYNSGNALNVNAGSGNTWVTNEIFSNGAGIVLGGSVNGSILPPAINTLDASNVAGTSAGTERIHIYLGDGNGQGQTLIDSVDAVGGNWSYGSLSLTLGEEIVVTATDVNGTSAFNSQTYTLPYPVAEGAGTALALDGVDDYVSFAPDGAYDLNTGSSVEMWIQPNWLAGSNSANPAIISVRNGTTVRYSLHINDALDEIGLANGIDPFRTVNYAFTQGEWHHVAFVFEAVNTLIYIDGEFAGTLTGTTIENPTAGLPLSIGWSNDAGNPEEYFTGGIDEVRIWNTELTESTIREWLAKKVTNTHPEFGNLAAYYRFDDAAPSAINNFTGGLTGAEIGGALLQSSGAHLGDTSFYEYTYTTGSGRGLDVFRLENLGTANLPLHIYRVSGTPANNTIAGFDNIADTAYYGIFSPGQTYDVVDSIGNLTSDRRIVYRADGADPTWVSISGALGVDIEDDQIYAYGQSGSGQFTTAIDQNPYPTPLDAGHAMSFDGVADYITVPHSSSIDFSGQFTVEAWISPDGSATPQGIVSKFNNEMVLWLDGSTLRYEIGGGAQANCGTIPSGEWTHVALTYDGADARVYVNGLLVFTNPEAQPSTSTRLLYIGSWDQNEFTTRNFVGDIDEVRIWDVQLTETNIRDHMIGKLDADFDSLNHLVSYFRFDENSGVTVANLAGDADGTVTGATPVISGAPQGQGSLYSYTGSPGILNTAQFGEDVNIHYQDASAGIHGYVVQGNPNQLQADGFNNLDQGKYYGVFAPGQTVDIRLDYNGVNDPQRRIVYRKDASDNAASGGWERLSGLINTSSTLDSVFAYNVPTGEVSTATLNPSSSYPMLGQYDPGSALDFDGTTQYVQLPNFELDPSVENFTIELWAKPTALGGTDNLFVQEDGTGTGRAYLYLTGNTLASLLGGSTIQSGAPTVVNNDTWYHFAVTYDGVNVTTYIDAVQEAQAAVTPEAASGAFRIGSSKTGASTLTGDIDEVRIWNEALTQTELSNFANTTDISSHPNYSDMLAYYKFDDGTGSTILEDVFANNDGVLTNMDENTDWVASGALAGAPQENALNFDGSDDYLSFTRQVFPTGLTYEAWINTTSTANTTLYNGNPALVVVGDNDNSVEGAFGVHDGKVRYTHWQGSATNFDQIDGTAIVNDGLWHHIAVTHDQGSNEVRLYVDGVLDTIAISTNYFTTVAANRVGSSYLDGSGNDNFFVGDIDEVRIWDTVIDEAEIRNYLYANNLGSHPNNTNLVLHYNFNQGDAGNNNTSETAVADQSSSTLDGTLNGFTLNGATSNFISSNAFVHTPTASSVQATNITVSNVTETTADISWTNGDGQRRIVAIFEGIETEMPIPSDNQFFSADPMFMGDGDIVDGTWYAVYSGYGGSVSITGLNAGQDYTIAVLEVNGPAGQEAYNSGADTDNPLNFTTSAPITNYALEFDGSAQYVAVTDAPQFDIDTDWTIEAWIKTPSTGQQNIIGQIAGTTGYSFFKIGGTLYLQYYSSGGFQNAGTSLSVAAGIDDDQWHHVAVSQNGSNGKIYVDGSPLLDVNVMLPIDETTDEVRIGYDEFVGAFTGSIDEVRFWDYQRSDSEIFDHYDSELVGNEVGLVAYYPLNDGSPSTVATDATGNGNDGTLTSMDENTDWVAGPVLSQPIIPDATFTTIAVPGTTLTTGSVDNLIYKFSVSATGGDITKEGMSIAVGGDATTADFSANGWKLYESENADNGIGGASLIGSTNIGDVAVDTVGFVMSGDILDGDTHYFYLAVDIDATASVGNSFNAVLWNGDPTESVGIADPKNKVDGGFVDGNTFTIQSGDVTPPTPVISSSESDPTNANPIVIDFDFGENVTGFAQNDITVSNGSKQNFNNVDGQTYTVEIVPASDGLVTVNIAAGRVQDLAGNGNLVATQFTINYDGTGPSITLDQNGLTVNDTNLSGTIGDPTDVIQISVDGGTTLSNVSNEGDGTWSYALDTDPNYSGDATYSIYLDAVDELGNQTLFTTGTVTIDQTAPMITVDETGTSIRNPQITGEIDDPVASIEIEIDGESVSATNNEDGTWTLAAGSLPSGLADGTYDVIATATDVVGNIGSDNTTDELIISQTIVALSPTDINSTGFTARWSTGLDVQTYQIDISSSSDFSTFVDGFESFETTATGLFVTNLDFSTNYYYRVRLVNTNDVVSANSNTRGVKTTIDLPTLADSLALVQIYDAISPQGLNWETERLRDWDGVTLDLNRTRVDIVNISNTQAAGNMPNPFTGDALSNGGLNNLTGMDVSDNEITGLMDFTSTAVSTLFVNSNRLDFGDLEPIASLGIGTLDYSDQANIQFNETTDGSPIEVRYANDYSLSMTIGGSNNTFSWFRNDSPISTETDFVIESSEGVIVAINYDNMGDFRAEVTSSLVPGLTILADPQTVWAVADMQVSVTDADGNSLTAPLDASMLETTRTATGFRELEKLEGVSTSTFTFPDVILGDYIIFVESDIAKYIPTYYGDVFEWTKADTLFFRSDDVISMTMTEVPPELKEGDGPGTLDVLIEEDFGDDEGRIDARRRAAKRKCGLRRRTRAGRTDQDDDEFELIAYGETDENGEFQFGFLPEGTYRFFVEYPGIPLDESSFVQFEVGEEGVSDTDFKLAAFATEDGVEVTIEAVLGVILEYFKDLQIYPNPSSQYLNVKYRHLKSGDITAQLVDLAGNTKWSQDLRNGYDGEIKIDVSDYEEGIYVLRFYDREDAKNNVVSFRVIVRD